MAYTFIPLLVTLFSAVLYPVEYLSVATYCLGYIALGVAFSRVCSVLSAAARLFLRFSLIMFTVAYPIQLAIFLYFDAFGWPDTIIPLFQFAQTTNVTALLGSILFLLFLAVGAICASGLLLAVLCSAPKPAPVYHEPARDRPLGGALYIYASCALSVMASALTSIFPAPALAGTSSTTGAVLQVYAIFALPLLLTASLVIRKQELPDKSLPGREVAAAILAVLFQTLATHSKLPLVSLVLTFLVLAVQFRERFIWSVGLAGGAVVLYPVVGALGLAAVHGMSFVEALEAGVANIGVATGLDFVGWYLLTSFQYAITRFSGIEPLLLIEELAMAASSAISSLPTGGLGPDEFLTVVLLGLDNTHFSYSAGLLGKLRYYAAHEYVVLAAMIALFSSQVFFLYLVQKSGKWWLRVFWVGILIQLVLWNIDGPTLGGVIYRGTALLMAIVTLVSITEVCRIFVWASRAQQPAGDLESRALARE